MLRSCGRYNPLIGLPPAGHHRHHPYPAHRVLLDVPADDHLLTHPCLNGFESFGLQVDPERAIDPLGNVVEASRLRIEIAYLVAVQDHDRLGDWDGARASHRRVGPVSQQAQRIAHDQ